MSFLAKHADDHGINEEGKCLHCGAVFVHCGFCLMLLDVKLWSLSAFCAWLLQGLEGSMSTVWTVEERGEVLYDGPVGAGDAGQGYY